MVVRNPSVRFLDQRSMNKQYNLDRRDKRVMLQLRSMNKRHHPDRKDGRVVATDIEEQAKSSQSKGRMTDVTMENDVRSVIRTWSKKKSSV